MKPSNWLLAAIRALAASMMGCTASARTLLAEVEDNKTVPDALHDALRVRFGGGASLAGCDPCYSFDDYSGKVSRPARRVASLLKHSGLDLDNCNPSATFSALTWILGSHSD